MFTRENKETQFIIYLLFILIDIYDVWKVAFTIHFDSLDEFSLVSHKNDLVIRKSNIVCSMSIFKL